MSDGSVKIEVGMNIGKAEKDLARLKEKINKAEDALNANANRKSELEKQIANVGAQADEAKRKVIELKDQLGATRSREEKASIRAQLADATEEQRILSRESNRLNDEYVKVSNSIEKGNADLSEMKTQAGELSQQIERAKPGEALANSFETAKKKLTKFLKYAIGIRSVYILFQRLKTAIKSAVQEYADYDEELKYNLALMSATKKAIQVTNGAALASIYQAVLPIIQKIANWMLEAANAASRFIAILSGKDSYKRAVVNAQEVADSLATAEENTEDGAEDADDLADGLKEAKRQTLGFDELNIISSDKDSASKAKSGKGSVKEAAKAALDGIDVVEESIDGFDGSLLDKIAVFIRDHLKEIKDAALGIGAALGTWKLGKLIEKLTGLSIATGKLLGVALAVGGSIVYIKGFFDAWENGLDKGNLTEMIGGAAAAIIGLGLAFGPIGAGIGALVTGIGLAAVGLKEWAETGDMATETLTAIDVGIGVVGLAVSLLTGSWIPLAVAAIGALLFSIPEILSGLSDFFFGLGMDNLGEWFKGMSEKAEKAREWLRTNVVNPVCDYITKAFNEWNSKEHRGEYKDAASWFICGVLGLPTDREWKQWGINAVNWLGKGFFGLTDILHELIGGPLENLIEVEIPETLEWFKHMGPTAKNWIIEGFLNLRNDLSLYIGNPFREFMDGLFEWWSNLRLQPFHIPHPVFEWGTKEATGLIAKAMEFVGLEPILPTLSISWYAKGGVFDMPSLIGVGEDGKEAVVPLEKNTGWMQLVADGLMERFERANFASQLATAFSSTPMPAMAGGGIVPPRAIAGGMSALSDADITKLVSGISNAINASNGARDMSIKVYLDGRQISDAVTKYQRRDDKAGGR